MLLVPFALSSLAFAKSGGISGQVTAGCTCHNTNPAASTTVTLESALALVGPGALVDVTVSVASSNVNRVEAGLDVEANGGTFVAGAGTKVSAGDITHTAPRAFVSGATSFTFEWTAPAKDGLYTLSAAGLASNASGTDAGDGWNYAADLVIEVDAACTDTDLDGVDACNGDCDDGDADVLPGAVEVCDGKDNDCDLGVDEDAVDVGTWYADLDRDGYGAGEAVVACEAPFDFVADGADCDDANGAVSPAAVEVCDAADVDEDCDGFADGAGAIDALAWYADADADGFGAGAGVVACEAPPGHVLNSGDCDDTSDLFHPAAPEPDCADPTDWNCDGSTGFADADLDGFAACVECDDLDGAENPTAFETCDGDDDDCDGVVDEPDAIDAGTYYLDADLDGFGDAAYPAPGCVPPEGYVATATDCNDVEGSVFPTAVEVWYDDIDQNCDGNDDDQDGDGVPSPADCADQDPAVAPGSVDEPCDDIDLDCDPGPDDPAGCDTTTTPPPTEPGTPTLPAPTTSEGEAESPPPPVAEPGCACESGPAPALWAAPWLVAAVILRRRRAAAARAIASRSWR